MILPPDVGIPRLVGMRAGVARETRVDTYWVVEGRPDLGIKLRGAQSSLEIKVRYERRDEWELWEKVLFQAWTALESVRCAALLQICGYPEWLSR